MSAGFTPGPWRIGEEFVITAPDTDPNGQPEQPWMIAYVQDCVGFDGDRQEANARLIAAAPELYEELAQNADGCSTIISLLRGQTSPVAASLIGMLQIQEQSARAVLAKARGEQ